MPSVTTLPSEDLLARIDALVDALNKAPRLGNKLRNLTRAELAKANELMRKSVPEARKYLASLEESRRLPVRVVRVRLMSELMELGLKHYPRPQSKKPKPRPRKEPSEAVAAEA